MKVTFLICCILAFALSGLTCTPGEALSVSVTQDSLSLSVAEVDGGVMIENLSTVPCIVLVSSPEGEQQFELAVGESVTVTGIAKPIEVAAVSLATR